MLIRACAALLALVLSGCGGASAGGSPRVFAAGSLRDVLPAAGGAGAGYVFDGTPALLRQLADGARADVLVTADAASMDAAVRAGLARDPVLFARNRLVVVVARGNPRRVTGLADLSRPGLRVALAGPAVPAGRYARAAFGRAGAALPRASEEPSARAVLAKVALGEADAGVVYATDVRAARGVEAVPLPAAHDVAVSYLAAVVRPSDAARAFVARLRSAEAARELAAFGFLPP